MNFKWYNGPIRSYDVYRTFHPKTMNFTFFSSAHRTFSRTDHILGHKSGLGKSKKPKIISSIFSDHNAVRFSSVQFSCSVVSDSLRPHESQHARPPWPSPTLGVYSKPCPKIICQLTKIMASGPITSWQIDGETVETVADFIFLGSKITADGDCSHEIKRCLLLGRKINTNPDSILKSRDRCEGDLVATSVTPLIDRVDSADLAG